MMITDLIDQDDFRDHLVSLGYELPHGISAEEACQRVAMGICPERARVLKRMVETMLSGSATLLPAVREAINRHLLPALLIAR
jgi:hypothetical protein